MLCSHNIRAWVHLLRGPLLFPSPLELGFLFQERLFWNAEQFTDSIVEPFELSLCLAFAFAARVRSRIRGMSVFRIQPLGRTTPTGRLPSG
jgi:hypothetical protein